MVIGRGAVEFYATDSSLGIQVAAAMAKSDSYVNPRCLKVNDSPI